MHYSQGIRGFKPIARWSCEAIRGLADSRRAPTPDITLQGASARGEGGQKLQRYFRDGTFAEQVRVPTENAAPIGTIDPAEAGQWCAVGTLLVCLWRLAGDGLSAGRKRCR